MAETKPWPDPRYFYGGPTHDQARLIAWEDLKALCPPQWIDDIKEGDAVIKTVFNSRLHVIGLDKPQRMEGPPWDGGIFDEGADHKPGTFWRTIYPALADRKGWCWWQGVPKRAGSSATEFKNAYFDARRGLKLDWEAFTWKSAEVGHLDPQVIQTAQETLDPKTYREQFEASFESAGGQIYSEFSREYNVRTCLYNPSMPILIGSDFNVTPMSWVLCHLYKLPDGTQYLEVFDELWIKDTTTPRTLDELWRRYGTHKAGFQFYGDAAGKARHTNATITDYQGILNDARFMVAGRTVHYPRANPARADRYACVNSACKNSLGRNRLFVDPKCIKLIEDLESVYYDEGTREAAKVGDLTHISDALGYICHRKFPIVVQVGTQDARFGV